MDGTSVTSLCFKDVFKSLKNNWPVHCAKKSSPSVDSSLFIARLWNRGLVSVGFSKPSSVPRQTAVKQAKRQQYQRFADVPISVFEIFAQINKTGP
ncbi:unnamed protein product, partial [Porites lobata]